MRFFREQPYLHAKFGIDMIGIMTSSPPGDGIDRNIKEMCLLRDDIESVRCIITPMDDNTLKVVVDVVSTYGPLSINDYYLNLE